MNRLLKAEDVAELFGVRVPTVYSWARRGRIPHMKLGRLIRFRLDELWRFLNNISGREDTDAGRDPEKPTPTQADRKGDGTRRDGRPKMKSNHQEPSGKE